LEDQAEEGGPRLHWARLGLRPTLECMLSMLHKRPRRVMLGVWPTIPPWRSRG
jgi:hypothetical protein